MPLVPSTSHTFFILRTMPWLPLSLMPATHSTSAELIKYLLSEWGQALFWLNENLEAQSRHGGILLSTYGGLNVLGPWDMALLGGIRRSTSLSG